MGLDLASWYHSFYHATTFYKPGVTFCGGQWQVYESRNYDTYNVYECWLD